MGSLFIKTGNKVADQWSFNVGGIEGEFISKQKQCKEETIITISIRFDEITDGNIILAILKQYNFLSVLRYNEFKLILYVKLNPNENWSTGLTQVYFYQKI